MIITEKTDEFGLPAGTDTESEKDMGLKVEEEHRETLEKLIKKLSPEIDEESLNDLVAVGIEGIADDHLKEHEDYYTKLKSLGL